MIAILSQISFLNVCIKTRFDVYETLCPNRCLYIKVAKFRTGVGVQRHHTYKIAVSNNSKSTSKSKSSKGDNSKKIN